MISIMSIPYQVQFPERKERRIMVCRTKKVAKERRINKKGYCTNHVSTNLISLKSIRRDINRIG
ncbi:Uncharacterised protein [uncultured Bacteroides sp.]|nr:Uncharacterised protein [uncultured Bacteroides sp.]